MKRSDVQPAVAGVVAAIIGFASSVAIVLAGLRAVGATRPQLVSGLLVLCLGMGITGIVLCWRLRMPVSIAWSTPGAALLIAAGPVHGGYRAALGAFVFAGTLTILAWLARPFERLIASIPGPVASGLLAGVLLPICLAPARAVVSLPVLAVPVVATWLVLRSVRPRVAVPGALLAATVAVAVDGRLGRGAFGHVVPSVTAALPRFDLRTIASLGVPLFLVTMASQNLAGLSVLALHGYRPRIGPILGSTGVMSTAIASLGGHAVNLAAITAGLMAGPAAGDEPERRWIAGVAAGVTYLVLGPTAAVASALIAHAPVVLVDGVAGLALLDALSGSLTSALRDANHRDAALCTFVVTASGVTAGGLDAPVLGLMAGFAALALATAASGRGDRGRRDRSITRGGET